MLQLNVQYMRGQCCGSGSVSELHPDSMGYLDPDLGGQKLPTKKKVKTFYIFKCLMLSFEGWRLLLLLERPFGGLGISKLKVLIIKRKQKNQWYFFISVFGHRNPGSGLSWNGRSRSRSTDLCMAKGLLCSAGWWWWTSCKFFFHVLFL